VIAFQKSTSLCSVGHNPPTVCLLSVDALGYMIRERTSALKAWNLSVVLCTQSVGPSVIIVSNFTTDEHL